MKSCEVVSSRIISTVGAVQSVFFSRHIVSELNISANACESLWDQRETAREWRTKRKLKGSYICIQRPCSYKLCMYQKNCLSEFNYSYIKRYVEYEDPGFSPSSSRHLPPLQCPLSLFPGTPQLICYSLELSLGYSLSSISCGDFETRF